MPDVVKLICTFLKVFGVPSPNSITVFELPKPWAEIGQVGLYSLLQYIDAPATEPHGLVVREGKSEMFDVGYYPRDTPNASICTSASDPSFLSEASKEITITLIHSETGRKGQLSIGLYPDRVHVFDFNIEETIRNNGLGRILLDVTLGIAALTERDRISLKFKNEGGVAFLESYGFREEQIKTKYCESYDHNSVVVGAASLEELKLPDSVSKSLTSKEIETPIHNSLSGLRIEEVDAPNLRVFTFRNADDR